MVIVTVRMSIKEAYFQAHSLLRQYLLIILYKDFVWRRCYTIVRVQTITLTGNYVPHTNKNLYSSVFIKKIVAVFFKKVKFVKIVLKIKYGSRLYFAAILCKGTHFE